MGRRIVGHPRRTLLIALVVGVASLLLGAGVADRLGPYKAEDPATESIRLKERVKRAVGTETRVSLIALVRGDVRVTRTRRAVTRLARGMRREGAVASVATYYSTRDRAFVSRGRRFTLLAARFRSLPDLERQEAATRLADQLAAPGVRFGGPELIEAEVNDIIEVDLRRAELVALPILFLLSFWVFRGLVAAAMPPLVGILAIVTSLLGIRIANEAVELSVYSLNIVTALGLGLAIDYSLLIVSRFREELAQDRAPPEALRRTLATAGRTVLFSSLTVAAAMAALLVFPQQFLYSMGLGGVLVALLAGATSLIVLPAVLAALGHRINSLAPARLQRSAAADARPESQGRWYRLARLVMRRPVPVATLSALALVAIGLPFLRVEFIGGDHTTMPRDAETRQVTELVEREFPPNRDEPIYVLAETRSAERLAELRRRIEGVEGISAVGAPQPLTRGSSLIEAPARAGPLTETSQDVVKRLRALPAEVPMLVGGESAEYVDQKESIGDHLPLAVGVVLGATFLTLFLMTGSLVLPIKTLLMNALTVAAAFGVLVFVFQGGRFEGLLGYDSRGALDISQPVLVFAMVFGLSTDYGVFLLERIREAYRRGASNTEAVALGLERTGRIVTAAAVLFCIAVGATLTSRIVFVKELALGVSLAVLIDATLVRAFLVPALMRLLGSWNWWAPAPLRRLQERLTARADPPPIMETRA